MADRHKTVDFFLSAFGYKIQTEFDIQFDDGSTARCFALEPPEKLLSSANWVTTIRTRDFTQGFIMPSSEVDIDYHLPPEIFVSDGTSDSIVGQWVAKRDGIGGIHHLAYQVPSVEAKMKEWQEKGYAEFTTNTPLTCPDLVQVFTKPSQLTGVIYEFIERGAHGFCKDNVQQLMLSTANIDQKVIADFPGGTI